MQKIKTIKELIKQLDKCNGNIALYHEVMELLSLNQEETEKYYKWQDDFYTRNLIHRNNDFELVILCWQPGQASPVHDHDHQHGWIKVIEGEITEIWYKLIDHEGDKEIAKLEELKYKPGELSYINDDIALHSIHNKSKKRAVSLHLYAHPVDKCTRYDLKTGKASIYQMGYTKI